MPDNQPPTPKIFLTNQGENTLRKRLEQILPLTQNFDRLVGDFFICGYKVGGVKSGKSFLSVHRKTTRQNSKLF